jgi:hypothetical protein
VRSNPLSSSAESATNHGRGPGDAHQCHLTRDIAHLLGDIVVSRARRVFDYRVTLPLYLWAISTYLVVGRASGLQFFSDTLTKSDLGGAASVLAWVYNKVMPLSLLSPPDWTFLGLSATACPEQVGDAQPGDHGPTAPLISGVILAEKYVLKLRPVGGYCSKRAAWLRSFITA